MAAIIEGMAKKIEAEKDYLTQLDNEIGDGDHGINLARGFEAVEKKLPSLAGGDIGALLKGVGMQLVSTVGGASGPLYGPDRAGWPGFHQSYGSGCRRHQDARQSDGRRKDHARCTVPGAEGHAG